MLLLPNFQRSSGILASPFLIGVAKVCAFCISAKFFLKYFEDFFLRCTQKLLKNYRFFLADGKDRITALYHQVFSGVFYSQPIHPEFTLKDLLLFSKAGRKDKPKRFRTKYFLPLSFPNPLKCPPNKDFTPKKKLDLIHPLKGLKPPDTALSLGISPSPVPKNRPWPALRSL